MLNLIVGQIDWPGAFTLFGLGAAVVLICTVVLYRPDRHANVELADRKLTIEERQYEMVKKFDHEQVLAKIAANREVQIAQIDHRTIDQAPASNYDRDADHG